MSVNGLIQGYAEYNDAVRQVASETGALLIDGENSIPGDAQHFADSVHFTDKGSHLMARRVARGLIQSPRLQELAANILSAKRSATRPVLGRSDEW